jgi:hypothetical protein
MAVRLRLEAEGVPTFLDGERMASEAWLATGGVRLQVPDNRLEQARTVLLGGPCAVSEEDEVPCSPHFAFWIPSLLGWLGAFLGLFLAIWLIAQLLGTRLPLAQR